MIVNPRSVNRLIAKLFPGPGNLFHLRLHISFFGSKIFSKIWICRFVHTIPCNRSNIDPRTVNKLVAKLFPGPGDLFHPDKAILSRHCWLSEKQVTSINILESDLEKMAVVLKENWCCRKKHFLNQEFISK